MLNFSNPSLTQLFQQAVQHHMTGRSADAERTYRTILQQDPNHAECWHMLGVLACQLGKYDLAIQYIGNATTLAPASAVYHSNLGEAFRQANKPIEAEQHFHEAIRLDPHLADARTNLASLYCHLRRDEDALAAAQGALAIAPTNATAYRFMGDALARLRRSQEAAIAYENALTLKPDLHDVRFNVAILHAEAGHMDRAESLLRQVIAAVPDDWEAHIQLAEVLERTGRSGEAFTVLTELLKLNPKFARGHARLANILRTSGRLDEALQAYAAALSLDPDDWLAMANGSFALRDQARLDEAIALQRQALARHPNEPALHSGLIFTMHLAPNLTPEEIRQEQQRWNRAHAGSVASQRSNHSNDRSPDRVLKIGYVSADLRSHSVGRFMLPLLKHHDRSRVHVTCYQASRGSDAVTKEIAAASDAFIPLGTLSDQEASDLIRSHGIDILIDLNNHTIDNRMPLFARKPAPVQISYLAFCAGTGLETMDWRLTDPLIDPPGAPDDALPFEKPLRLPRTYWCYAPHSAAGEVMPLPALKNGHITFGAFNYFSKCNDHVLVLWARLLAQIPSARLHFHVPSGSRQQHVRDIFTQAGETIAQRLTFIPRVKEDLYFRNYGTVDVALDPFPWAGGTTTCDALFMGVPVITLAGVPGQTLQRGGVSLLTNLGHPEWIADSPEEYIAKARELAGNVNRLAEIRAGLRQKMQTSVLMDAPRFARDVEEAYRQAWRQWCGGNTTPQP